MVSYVKIILKRDTGPKSVSNPIFVSFLYTRQHVFKQVHVFRKEVESCY